MNETQLFYDSYLAHHGIKGMKWGRRRWQNADGSLTPAGKKRYGDSDGYTNTSVKRVVRGHAGPGMYATKKRQLEGDKRDLEGLKKGQHLSVGLTKKRQAALDARDKAALEKRIAKNERPSKLEPQKGDSTVTKRVKKDYNTLSDQEFMNKYSGSKDRYAKRVEKYGDPYMNAPLAKIGKKLRNASDTELAKRGKAAVDVLLNGDKDALGFAIESDNVMTEARNRGKAALERLMYSADQIENKKVFGRYNF